MEQMKFVEKEGLEVEWVKFAEVNGPTRAIVSNAIDVAFAAPSTNSMGIAGDGVPVKIVLATQIAEAQVVVLDGSPIKTIAELKDKKIGMSPPGSATHAISNAILNQNFGIKPKEYSVAPGNEARLAQFLTHRAGFDPAIFTKTSRFQIFSQELDAGHGGEQLQALRRAQEDFWFSGSGQTAHGVRHLREQVPLDRCRGLPPPIRVNRVCAYARRVR